MLQKKKKEKKKKKKRKKRESDHFEVLQKTNKKTKQKNFEAGASKQKSDNFVALMAEEHRANCHTTSGQWIWTAEKLRWLNILLKPSTPLLPTRKTKTYLLINAQINVNKINKKKNGGEVAYKETV